MSLFLLALGLAACGGDGDDGGPDNVTVSVTFTTWSYSSDEPVTGVQVSVDGTNHDTPYSTRWRPGETHRISVPSPQLFGSGRGRYLFHRWADSYEQTREVSVDRATTFEVRLVEEYELVITVTPEGTGTVEADPPGPWIPCGTGVVLTATPIEGWVLDRWEGSVTGDENPTILGMCNPASVTAVFIEGPGTVSGSATQLWDGAPLVGLEIYLIANGDTTTTTTDSNGDYEFTRVLVGSYTVAADTTGLEPFGQFTPSREQAITVGQGEDVTGIDFGYQRAQIEVRTLADISSVSVGATVTITLELDLSAIPLPASTLTGTVGWDAAVADYAEGSASGGVWDQLEVNESPAGTLGFAAISANGVGDAVLIALTYEVVATATGTTEFDPVLQELSVIDPATGEAVDLLSITTVIEIRAGVSVQ
jgi:hypothetical protein